MLLTQINASAPMLQQWGRSFRSPAPQPVFQSLMSLKRWREHACAANKPQSKRQRVKKNGQPAKFIASAPTAPVDSAEDRVLRERVDKASDMLNGMMEEIHQNLFVNGAVAEVTGKPPDVSEAEAIKAAVAGRMEQLDEAFLVALGAYCNAAQQQGNIPLAGRLSRIQQQVLQQVSERLPPEMQVLDKMLSLLSRGERLSLLKTCVQGGDSTLGLPACDIRRIQGAALQLISDMEEKEAIPDRRLLARLCIAQTEIVEVASEQRWQQTGITEDVDNSNVVQHTQAVPKAAIAFLKELLTVSDPAVRIGFLQKAFREDFDPTTQLSSAQASPAADNVRPGSFLSCVSATQKQMQSMKGSDATLRKLEQIWREALQVLGTIAE